MMVEKKVPGALERIDKGEVIPEWEYVTEGKLGWEYRQVLAGVSFKRYSQVHYSRHLRSIMLLILQYLAALMILELNRA